MVTVLVVDDSALMRRALKGMLVDAGFDVRTARNGLDALAEVRRERPDVVTLDVNMPEMDGMSCLAELMADDPLPVVMVSSLTDANASLTFEALELGAVDYVLKPGGTVSLDIESVRRDLVAKVRGAAVARIRRAGGLRSRLARQREETETAAGRSVARSSVRARTAAAPTTTSTRAVRGPVGRADRPVGTPAYPSPQLVLIGSSTGGPSALSEVLAQLPADFSAPVVIAQHIPASFTKHLAGRLDDLCALSVRELFGTEPLVPGTVYLARGDADVVIARRPNGLVARSVPSSDEHRWHPSVDRLVASALAYCPNPSRIVGVLLTGMGDDGAAEMTRLHDLGGRTIAESEQTAVVYGMPAELYRRGGADLVLPLDGIGSRLAAWG